jgi:hypothetical protein
MSSTTGAIMGIIQAEMEGQVKERNAQMAKWEAGSALTQAGIAARQQWQKDRFAMGMARAKYARAGVSLDSGSPLTMELSNTHAAITNRANIMYKGEYEATSLRNRAALEKWSADTGRTFSYINLGAAIISDVAKVFTYGATGDHQNQQFRTTEAYQSYRMSERQNYSSNIPRVNE